MSRKAAEDFIIDQIEKILPGTVNSNLYRKRFKSMSNKEFSNFIDDLRNGNVHLSVISPNGSSPGLSVKRNISLAAKLGKSFFSPLHYANDPDMPDYTTPISHMVCKVPFRRTSQLLVKSVSVPEDDKSIDLSTGQATGKSKGAKLTYVEIQMLAAMGLDKTIVELIKYRGGDKGGYKALKMMISKYGEANQEVLDKFSSKVVSTTTFSSYLSSMHLRNNL